jgi:hypothetical protein
MLSSVARRRYGKNFESSGLHVFQMGLAPCETQQMAASLSTKIPSSSQASRNSSLGG